MTIENQIDNQTTDSTIAAKQAAEQATAQAKELAANATSAMKALEPKRMYYVMALGVVVLFTLVFAMPSFSVGSAGPVSETQAMAERNVQATLNSWSYSAFSSTIWGKIMWLSALAGIAIVIWSAVKDTTAGWVPLAEVGCAAMAMLMLMLLYVVGFPSLPSYSEYTHVNVSATLFGYWIPLVAAGFATAMSVKRIVDA